MTLSSEALRSEHSLWTMREQLSHANVAESLEIDSLHLPQVDILVNNSCIKIQTGPPLILNADLNDCSRY